jgi:hypothetical protein
MNANCSGSIGTARGLFAYFASQKFFPCELNVSDDVKDLFCTSPAVFIDSENPIHICFSPAEFDSEQFVATTDVCKQLFGKSGGVWWTVDVLDMKFVRMDSDDDWRIVHRGILDRLPRTFEMEANGCDYVEVGDDCVYDLEEAILKLLDERMRPDFEEIRLRDVRSHADDVKEVVAQLREIPCDGFYSGDDGEYYLWRRDMARLGIVFDMVSIDELAEKLVSNFE